MQSEILQERPTFRLFKLTGGRAVPYHADISLDR
jgi:hypothetical protein